MINVFITLGFVFFFLKIAPEIYKKSDGWFRTFYNPDYKVGYIFVANLISSGATLINASALYYSYQVCLLTCLSGKE